jgi:hypothetical protein
MIQKFLCSSSVCHWIRSVLKNRPDLTRAQLERTRDLMNAHARDALVQGFEDLIPSPMPQARARRYDGVRPQ